MSRKKSEEKSMSLAEARAYRASLAKAKESELTMAQKREAFRIYWAKEKSKYSQTKDIEQIIWIHLKAIKMETPEKFADGIKNFGLKKIK